MYAVNVVMVVTVLAGAGVCGTANGSPWDGPAGPQCTWVPVAPSVVGVSDVKMVTATMRIAACTLESTEATVCLSIRGEDSNGNCVDTIQSDPPRVYYKYVPGASYVMTARGCGKTFAPYNMFCQSFGPSYFTL